MRKLSMSSRGLASPIAQRKFPADNCAFANRVPVIVTEGAGFPNHAMTGNNESDRIGSDRATNGARGLRLTHCLSEPAVSCERADWNPQQCTPDAQLKLGASDKSAQPPIRCFDRIRSKYFRG